MKRKKSYRKWSQREKRTLLSVLKNFGHFNVNKFLEVLPHKSKCQISRYLNRTKKITSIKLKNNYFKMRYSSHEKHSWLSILNLNCRFNFDIYIKLASLTLPILEKYGTNLSQPPSNFEAENLKLAYRFLFGCLFEVPLNPTHISNENKAFLFACFNQMISEVRCEGKEVNAVFRTSVTRLIHQKLQNPIPQSSIIAEESSMFSAFEINPLGWTNEEIRILCAK